jgi:Flp pilus assembly protein TadG
MVLPLVLLVSAGIFEFGRAYQTWQVLTNAAREGARVAILPSSTASDVQSRVQTAMQTGQLQDAATATVNVNQGATVSIGAANASASVVTINYPFSFIVLNPVVNLVVKGSMVGTPITMVATAQMRNEAQ